MVNQENKNIHILAVDDNQVSLTILIKMLKRADCRVISAMEGDEALHLVKQDPVAYDVILLDRIMPNMDGIEVTKTMKADPVLRYIPIIMQTAASKPEEISEGIEAGVFYCLTKPLEAKSLLSVVAAGVENETILGDRKSVV